MTATQGSPQGGGKQPATSAPPPPQNLGNAVGNAVSNFSTSALPQSQAPVTPGQVSSLYYSMLGRAPDAGAAGWNGKTFGQVQAGIQGSPEFQNQLALSSQPAPSLSDPKYANPFSNPADFVNANEAWSKAQGAPTQQWAGQQLNNAANAAQIGPQIAAAVKSGMSPSDVAALGQRLNNTANGVTATPAPTPASTAGQPYGSTYQANVAANPYYQTQQGQAILAARQAGIRPDLIDRAQQGNFRPLLRQLKQNGNGGGAKMGQASPQVTGS